MAIGPTPLDNVARGVAEGRVGRTALVRHTSWNLWQRYEDIEALDTLALWHLVDRLGRASAEPPSQIRTEVPTQSSPVNGEPVSSRSSQRLARCSNRPAAVDPVGVLGQAQSFDEALLLTLSTAVLAASAHAGTVYQYQHDRCVATTACVQGIGTERLLGLMLHASDPVIVAALSGITVLGEPVLGEIGNQIADRFAIAGSTPVGVAMVPIRLFDKLIASIEIAQMERTFRAKEVSRVEEIADVLAERLVVNGWFEVPA